MFTKKKTHCKQHPNVHVAWPDNLTASRVGMTLLFFFPREPLRLQDGKEMLAEWYMLD